MGVCHRHHSPPLGLGYGAQFPTIYFTEMLTGLKAGRRLKNGNFEKDSCPVFPQEHRTSNSHDRHHRTGHGESVIKTKTVNEDADHRSQ